MTTPIEEQVASAVQTLRMNTSAKVQKWTSEALIHAFYYGRHQYSCTCAFCNYGMPGEHPLSDRALAAEEILCRVLAELIDSGRTLPGVMEEDDEYGTGLAERIMYHDDTPHVLLECHEEESLRRYRAAKHFEQEYAKRRAGS